MKLNYKNLLLWILIIGALILGFIMFSDMQSDEEKPAYSDVIEMLEEKLVVSMVYDTQSYLRIVARVPVLNEATGEYERDEAGNVIVKKNNKGEIITKEYIYRLAQYTQLEEIHRLAQERLDDGSLEKWDYEEPKDTPWFVSFLPYILIFGGLIFLFIYMSRASGRGKTGGFARSHQKFSVDEKNAVKFRDVAGAEEEKRELEEVVEFLRDPQKFVRLGARIPRGILLVGPPGTGKTLLAKAVAGEAGVPFYSISGSDFVEMYVGLGASRVRELFEAARHNPASIIFIDEIDAVGRHRGAGLGGGHDEREQTLNQLLVEMDGFGHQEGVIVMAATNRPDILDPALLRPGRFDRQVTVNYPDLQGREDILRVHVRNKPLEGNVDLRRVAQTTVGMTGADLANLLNEAALLAARRGKSLIGMQEIDEATLKVLVGVEKKGRVVSEKDRRVTAYHEAGHAIVEHLLPGMDPVTRITIIPTGKGAGGYTLMPPVNDQSYEFKGAMENNIAVSLAGRAAELIIFSDCTGGASADIKQATRVARRMVTVYGMSDELGMVCLAGEHGSDEVFLGRNFAASDDLSGETKAKIDKEIRRIITEGKEKAERLLRENIDKLHRVAEFLLAHEAMDGEQFAALMDRDASEEELLAIATAREEASRRENDAAAEDARRREEEERARIAREMEEALRDGASPIFGVDRAPLQNEGDSSITPEGRSSRDNNSGSEE